MGTISGSEGKFRAQVQKNGIRKSKTFTSKKAAKVWIAQTEYQIEIGEGIGSDQPCKALFERYELEITPRKASANWERKQFNKLHKMKLAEVKLSEVSKADIHDYIQDRLRTVQGATVNRELNMISNVFRFGVEWGLVSVNPVSGVTRPKGNPARNRLATDAEIDTLAHVAGFDGSEARTMQQRIYVAFLLAVESGMRLGEICGIRPRDVNGNVVHLPKTKNGSPRDVPLSKRAVELLALVQGNFNLSPSQMESGFRRLRQKAAIDDLHFHDSRHMAVTRLAKKLDVLALAKMIGHRDIKQLMTYYDESASSIADRL